MVANYCISRTTASQHLYLWLFFAFFAHIHTRLALNNPPCVYNSSPPRSIPLQ
ncbi:hypothetical protein BDZ94DRAFT_1266225 [Collybia nuda]|uniref:Uncharacterized protein n=1 Tax=Collybia nuda TaxID=64659 RepID=A0A9P5XZ40_9AGAR|nr:hypothetical protein BDZ94DRAFT_1266225 [Collybia nuda]